MVEISMIILRIFIDFIYIYICMYSTSSPQYNITQLFKVLGR